MMQKNYGVNNSINTPFILGYKEWILNDNETENVNKQNFEPISDGLYFNISRVWWQK
jgi:hypothetical protein